MSDCYVGLDVHKASICIAVLNADGKLVTESIIEISAATILDFLKGLRNLANSGIGIHSEPKETYC